MENELIWLPSSIFSAKENWHHILEQIQIFIDLWKPQQCIKEFRIEFNYLSGENIRFSILCGDDFKHRIAQKLDEYFINFFLRANFSVKKQALPINGIFLPHQPNTVRYGLYNILSGNPEAEQINAVISSAIIQALSPEPVDEESILTFAFYLYAGVFKAFKNRNVHYDIKKHSNYWANKHNESQLDEKIVEDKYEASKALLSEIFQEIMSGIPIGPWLDNWILTCETEIRRRSGFPYKENDLIQIGFGCINSINKHLGMSENMKLMLGFFINRTLEEA